MPDFIIHGGINEALRLAHLRSCFLNEPVQNADESIATAIFKSKLDVAEAWEQVLVGATGSLQIGASE